MLQITPQMKILVAVEPADFRKGIDGLVRLCKDTLGQDPFAGAVFVFRNRRGTAIKVLVYDGQGFWLCHKKQEEQSPSSFGIPEFRFTAHNSYVGIIGLGFLVPEAPGFVSRRRIMDDGSNTNVPPRARIAATFR
ncbi:MAG TPA: transposase [Planctomycetes bacterium]|jgi:hypothetical protein|nr:transposase [Planctomycetota bacterium]